MQVVVLWFAEGRKYKVFLPVLLYNADMKLLSLNSDFYLSVCRSGFPEVVFLLLNAGLSATQKDAFAQVRVHVYH